MELPSVVVEVSSARWVALSLYFMLNMCMSGLYVSLPACQDPLIVLYDVPNVDTLTNVFYVIYVPGTFLGIYLMQVHGLKGCTSVGGVMMIIAMWLRYFGACTASGGLTAQWLASVIGSLAQPLILNPCEQISSAWFPHSELNTATMIGETIPATFGAAIIAQVAVSHAQTIGQVRALLLGLAITSTFVVATYLFLQKEQPLAPPSEVARLQRIAHTNRKSIGGGSGGSCSAVQFIDIRVFIYNRNYMLLLLMFSLQVAVLCAVSAVVGTGSNYCSEIVAISEIVTHVRVSFSFVWQSYKQINTTRPIKTPPSRCSSSSVSRPSSSHLL